MGLGTVAHARPRCGREFGREHAVLLAAAVPTPFLVGPLVQAGSPIGIYAGYLVPAAALLVLGLTLARRHPEPTWARTGTAAALGAAGLAAALVVRYMTSPTLCPRTTAG